MELRFPLPVRGGNLRGAVFVDAGQVWATRSEFELGEIVVTPGFGLRYQSPVGPLRVDVAFNTQGPQSLTVLTRRVESCTAGTANCVRVEGREPRAFLRNTSTVVDLEQPVLVGSPLREIDTLEEFLNRFRLHFSIGQAF